jgi:hypothetical protein
LIHAWIVGRRLSSSSQRPCLRAFLKQDIGDVWDPFFWSISTALGSTRPLTKLHFIYFHMFSFGVPGAVTGGGKEGKK